MKDETRKKARLAPKKAKVADRKPTEISDQDLDAVAGGNTTLTLAQHCVTGEHYKKVSLFVRKV